MLYLDYSRKEGEWLPNEYGGNENLEAISLLRMINKDLYGRFGDVLMVAEESTAWGGVSRPVDVGGLGFGMKWDMGWMHDTLRYLRHEPVHRAYHHSELTFRMLYAFTENFCLALSHDEVVHGKGSLVNKMPGDEWQQFANLRLLYGYMYGMPGKKLLFMGGEFGQRNEWNNDAALDWWVLEYPNHQGIQRWVRDLNRVYRQEPALSNQDFDGAGFEWIDADDSANSVLAFIRKGWHGETVLVVCNFTPVPREGHRLGVPHGGWWAELLNSDAEQYWGTGLGNAGGVHAEEVQWNGRPFSLNLDLPPLSTLFFRWTP
jgi:1,4-alpha-glucan branching enzyme